MDTKQSWVTAPITAQGSAGRPGSQVGKKHLSLLTAVTEHLWGPGDLEGGSSCRTDCAESQHLLQHEINVSLGRWCVFRHSEAETWATAQSCTLINLSFYTCDIKRPHPGPWGIKMYLEQQCQSGFFFFKMEASYRPIWA